MVLPYIDMNQPQVYMCPLSRTLLPPPSSFHPSGSSQCTGFERPVSCIEPGLVIYFTYGNIHVSTLFSQIIPPSSSPTESKSLVFTSTQLFIIRVIVHVSEKAMAPHSSTLAWKIPWMEEPGSLQSMGSLRVGHD